MPFASELPSAINSTATWELREIGFALAPLAHDGLAIIGRELGLSAANERVLKDREVAGIRAES